MRCRALALSLLVLALAVACGTQEELLGTELDPPGEAADFQLQDQFGATATLAALRGRVVVLTFLYTNCPDICPVVAGHLRDAHEMLQDDADGVTMLAITVDPERDTAESALAYSRRWQMENDWSFLVGPRESLEPVWSAYYLQPSADHIEQRPRTSAAEAPKRGGPATPRESFTETYLVSHSAPIYLIDREGKLRVLHTLPFEPEALVHDIRILLGL